MEQNNRAKMWISTPPPSPSPSCKALCNFRLLSPEIMYQLRYNYTKPHLDKRLELFWHTYRLLFQLYNRKRAREKEDLENILGRCVLLVWASRLARQATAKL